MRNDAHAVCVPPTSHELTKEERNMKKKSKNTFSQSSTPDANSEIKKMNKAENITEFSKRHPKWLASQWKAYKPYVPKTADVRPK
jgi:hypothetical protein